MMNRNDWTPRRLVFVAALGAAVVMGSFAWTSSQAHEQVHRSDKFWAHVTYRGSQIESCPTAREMLADADAVVVGKFVAMEPGRVIGEPEIDDAAYYLAGTFEIDEVIHQRANEDDGLDRGKSIVLETFSFEGHLVDQLARSFPTERTLVFLRNKGVSAERIGLPPSVVAAESAYYRAMCEEGIVRDLPSGSAAVIPDDDRLAELAEETFDGAVAATRALAAEHRAGNE
jgi:hypothetical protein